MPDSCDSLKSTSRTLARLLCERTAAYAGEAVLGIRPRQTGVLLRDRSSTGWCGMAVLRMSLTGPGRALC